MAKHVFNNGTEAIAVYGEPKLARRKTLVRTRPVAGEKEVFKKEGGDLTAVQGLDLVVIPVDGSAEYPCKIELFNGSKGQWEETEPGSGLYRRTGICKYIPVPEGDHVTCNTLEGPAEVEYPNAIAIGGTGEVYTYRATWIENNLEDIS
jgi:hypothetical protein